MDILICSFLFWDSVEEFNSYIWSIKNVCSLSRLGIDEINGINKINDDVNECVEIYLLAFEGKKVEFAKESLKFDQWSMGNRWGHLGGCSVDYTNIVSTATKRDEHHVLRHLVQILAY